MILYISIGWYKVFSGNKVYDCYPRELICSCPSTKLECKHIKEIISRTQDKCGIEGL